MQVFGQNELILFEVQKERHDWGKGEKRKLREESKDR